MHRFDGSTQQGRFPAAFRPLLEASDGFLYGAADGGENHAGVLFKIDKAGIGFQAIHQFAGEEETGDSPLGGLVEWCDGALYGVTHEGGIDGAGTLFRLNRDGSGFAVLHVYIDAPNPGATEGTPRTPLVFAADGQLYGLTTGGTVAQGTIYRIAPRPALQIRTTPDAFVVSWPACVDGYALEQSSDVTDLQGWTRVDLLEEVIGSGRQVTLPRTGDWGFFRLRGL